MLSNWLNKYRSKRGQYAAFRIWLTPIGIDFFLELKEKYGKLDAMWMENGIPHIVHFREGMHVRNWMRKYTSCTYDYIENNWMDFVWEAIKDEKPRNGRIS